MSDKRARIAGYTAIILADAAAVTLVGAQLQVWGWAAYLAGLLALVFCAGRMRRDLSLIYLGIGLVALTPINTDIRFGHFLLMGLLLTLAIAVPYLVSCYHYRDYTIRFQLHHGRNWTRREIWYIAFTGVAAYFLLPFMLRTSGSYLNWTVEPGPSHLIRLFIGTNALGIWDELFFVCTVLGVLRRYLPFWRANAAQAVMFTSFLYELGFRSWAAGVIFGFALIQGYIFMKTESLLYVITIHLVADFVLYLTLLHLHHPAWLPLFAT